MNSDSSQRNCFVFDVGRRVLPDVIISDLSLFMPYQDFYRHFDLINLWMKMMR